MLLRRIVYLILLTFFCTAAFAEVFVIKNIRVKGLQRISLATVLSYLPIKPGDSIDTADTQDVIRALYEKDFFSDITLERSGNDLVINVVERSVISSLTVTGNSKITKKQLLEALRHSGVAEGQPLDPALLEAIKRAIINEYYNQSVYNAKVDIVITPQKRNRADVAIKIQEGPTAKIKSIRIVGNKSFKEKTLLKEISLTTTKLWSFLTHSDRYSAEKLDGDLEKIRTFYLDHGYLNVKVTADKVSITPDKKGIYIVIGVVEGDIFRLSKIEFDGDFIGKRAEILKLVTLKPGQVFSRKEVVETQEKIKLFLGDYGYGLADIKISDQKVDQNKKLVGFRFTVVPGHRVYIRHINFTGNIKTNDEVLRREMRLQEGSLFSLSKINESSRQIANLGYIENIEHKVTPVEESNNQVDLDYTFKETSAISANIQGGYSDRDGFLYGASLSDQNIFGTGKTVSIGFNNTRAVEFYKLGYHDPYFTQDKIGFSVEAYIQKTNPSKISGELSNYTRSIYGGDVFFDMPLSDYSQIGAGLGYEHIKINQATNKNDEIEDFLKNYGTVFNEAKLMARWNYTKFDKAIFPTSGFGHYANGELYGPLDSRGLSFYKLDYNTIGYLPLFMGFILRGSAEVGYGDGLFGRPKKLFFLKNFFAGGMGSLRGFESDTITNKEGVDKNKVVGGNILTLASASLIIPAPMKDIVRPSIFIDVGGVYENYFKLSDLRASYGFQIEWRTPLGAPITIGLGWPIKKKSWDYTHPLLFSISASI